SGEVRSVSLANNRVAEAAKLGFTRVIMPASCVSSLEGVDPKVKIAGVDTLNEAINKVTN
ncbi:MAG: DNA repair protein RadA, partial [Lachnospiraceae bacterium]|nr:DNA repair protein RadA [Lachnospiraceae bacterium]